MAKAKDIEKSGKGDDAEVIEKPAPVAKAKAPIDCPVAIGSLFVHEGETFQRTADGAVKL